MNEGIVQSGAVHRVHGRRTWPSKREASVPGPLSRAAALPPASRHVVDGQLVMESQIGGAPSCRPPRSSHELSCASPDSGSALLVNFNVPVLAQGFQTSRVVSAATNRVFVSLRLRGSFRVFSWLEPCRPAVFLTANCLDPLPLHSRARRASSPASGGRFRRSAVSIAVNRAANFALAFLSAVSGSIPSFLRQVGDREQQVADLLLEARRDRLAPGDDLPHLVHLLPNLGHHIIGARPVEADRAGAARRSDTLAAAPAAPRARRRAASWASSCRLALLRP